MYVQGRHGNRLDPRQDHEQRLFRCSGKSQPEARIQRDKYSWHLLSAKKRALLSYSLGTALSWHHSAADKRP